MGVLLAGFEDRGGFADLFLPLDVFAMLDSIRRTVRFLGLWPLPAPALVTPLRDARPIPSS